MTTATLVVRETAISAVINAAISVGFFLALFSPRAPVEVPALGPDFLPQAFMVALMGSLVPSLLLARRITAPAPPIIRRSILYALVALAAAGGGAFWICRGIDGQLDGVTAMGIKAAFGAGLAAIVTPLSVLATLRSSVRP